MNIQLLANNEKMVSARQYPSNFVNEAAILLIFIFIHRVDQVVEENLIRDAFS